MYYLLDSSFHQKGLGSSGCQSLPLYVYPLKKKSPLNADVASKKALRGLSEGTHEPKPYFNSNTKGDKIQGFRLQVTRGHSQPFQIITSDKYKECNKIVEHKDFFILALCFCYNGNWLTTFVCNFR